MDDILWSINRNQVNNKLEEINGLHQNYKFTIETEQDGKLPFLDVCLIHMGNKLQSTWYTKPTDSGLIMNYNAFAPCSYKRSVVQCFVHRIHRACSNWELFYESMTHAKLVRERNQYPADFYDPIISRRLYVLRSHHTTWMTRHYPRWKNPLPCRCVYSIEVESQTMWFRDWRVSWSESLSSLPYKSSRLHCHHWSQWFPSPCKAT